MKSLFKIFQDLKNEIHDDKDSFLVADIPKVVNHKIGVTEHGLPLFFVKCQNIPDSNILDYNLEYISIDFNRNCQLLSKSKTVSHGIYTIVLLKSESIDLQEYFIGVLYFMMLKLPPIVGIESLKKEVEALINLFNKFNKKPIKTIQGVWAELLVIEQSINPDYLIKSWHNSPKDKFDFNDGTDKVEVKSTSKSRRIHSFSLEQLNPNKGSKLIVSSMYVTETGVGLTIFDLVQRIENKLGDRQLIFKIKEVILDVLGEDFDKGFNCFFDYKMAVDSLAFYRGELIPKIDSSSIPKDVLNIHFDSDLSYIEHLQMITYDSVLHRSLI